MATIKAYTDINQAKTLKEILPLESADMFYIAGKGEPIFIGNKMVACGEDDYDALGGPDVLCWSLAGLLNILPKEGKYEPFVDIRYNRIEYHAVDDEIQDKDYLLCYADGCSLLDACYEIILKLHEQNLI